MNALGTASPSLRQIRQISRIGPFNVVGLFPPPPPTIVSWMIIPTLSQAHLSCECSAYLVTMYSHFSGKEKLWNEEKNKKTKKKPPRYDLPKQLSWMYGEDSQHQQSPVRGWIAAPKPKLDSIRELLCGRMACPCWATHIHTLSHQRTSLQELGCTGYLLPAAPRALGFQRPTLAPGPYQFRWDRENPFIQRPCLSPHHSNLGMPERHR